MGKLVRDLIPDIIRNDGRDPIVRRLREDQAFHALAEKLLEEARELQQATTPGDRLEEAADVYEVLLSIARSLGLTLEQVEAEASRKRQERGGFDNLLWLDS
jgi:predicted house-cleaning noncanonical NTP pyrophosphatase (MazG superfamily)